MAEQLSTPRITAAYLDNFVGKVVMLVGKVTQLRGDQATLDSEGTVTVLLNRDAHLSNGNAVQVIGKVNPDLSIKVLTSRDLGTSVGKSRSSSFCRHHGVPTLQHHAKCKFVLQLCSAVEKHDSVHHAGSG